MELPLNKSEQALLELLMEIPPKLEVAESQIRKTGLDQESITKVGIRYVGACFFEFGDTMAGKDEYEQYIKENRATMIAPKLHSTYLYDVAKFLLGYGLNPNTIFEFAHSQYNIMDQLHFVDNEYLAADTMRLFLEHGGNPNLIVDGKSIFEQIDFDIWFGSYEQYDRWRYDQWVHVWMVMVAFGGEIAGKGPMVETFKEYESNEMFDLSKLRDHRNYYYGLSIENEERALHVYDKETFWKVVQW